MDVKINRASIYDHGAILELLISWFDEAKVPNIPMPCAFTGVWLADLIARHIVFTAKIDGKLVGTLGLRFTHFPWNNLVVVLSDDFLMTDSEYRQFNVAESLIKAAKEFAKEFKHPLMIGHFSGLHAELKDKYLSQFHGFKYLGGHFIYTGESNG